MKKAATVFFQNPDDFDMFLGLGLVRAEQAQRLPGSGVDLAHFSPASLPECEGVAPYRFLLIGRLLWDKGVGEYVKAARQIIDEGRAVEFQLLGFLGVENSTAIPSETLTAWEREGVVRYLGSAEDVRPHIACADCVVLPSYYREGTPRSLLEAASMGRPLITADTVGCRDVVEDGLNGFLCQPRDANDLANKMRCMMNLSHSERVEMGRNGRRKMEREFDEQIVIKKYLQTVFEIISCSNFS